MSGADDKLAKVWDYQTKACVQTLEGHSHNVSAVCFHPELPVILTGWHHALLGFTPKLMWFHAVILWCCWNDSKAGIVASIGNQLSEKFTVVKKAQECLVTSKKGRAVCASTADSAVWSAGNIHHQHLSPYYCHLRWCCDCHYSSMWRMLFCIASCNYACVHAGRGATSCPPLIR